MLFAIAAVGSSTGRLLVQVLPSTNIILNRIPSKIFINGIFLSKIESNNLNFNGK
jgi:hypothetical protein